MPQYFINYIFQEKRRANNIEIFKKRKKMLNYEEVLEPQMAFLEYINNSKPHNIQLIERRNRFYASGKTLHVSILNCKNGCISTQMSNLVY